jgi:hypothetical protein
MSFETISLLLNWMELGALLAILFRLSSTFTLIANTQRDLRRAIYHLGDRHAAERALTQLKCHISSWVWLRKQGAIVDTERADKTVGLDDVSWAAHAEDCEATWVVPERHRCSLGKRLPPLALASGSQSACRCAGRYLAGHLARGPGRSRVSSAGATSRSEYPDALLSV